MSRLRFETAADLYDAFPTARGDVGVEASFEPSLDFIQSLIAADHFRAGFAFCAYLLPRRQAVRWGCECLRQSKGLRRDEEIYVAAAEAWVHAPEEPNRLRALELGSKGNVRRSGTWACLAAAWAGGAIPASGQNPVPAPPQSTAQAIRVALILGADAVATDDRHAMQRRWLQAGVRSALAGDVSSETLMKMDQQR